MACRKLLMGVVCLGLVAAAYCETPGGVDATTEKYHKSKKYTGGKGEYTPEYKEQYEHNYNDEPYFTGNKYYKGGQEYEYYEGTPSRPYYRPHNPSSPEYYAETPGYNPHPRYPEEYHYSRGKDFHQKDVSFDLKEDTPVTQSPDLNSEMSLTTTSIRTADVLGSQKSGNAISQVKVGSVAWSGTITKAATASGNTDAKLNWLLTFIITHKDWVGEIIAAGPGVSQYSTAEQEFPIVGGSGVFEGATGRVLFKPLLDAANAVTGYKYRFEMTLWPHKKRSDAVYTAASISAEIM